MTILRIRRAARLGAASLVSSLLAVAVGGCDSPFVEGWGQEEADTRTPAEKCEAREGWSWSGETCRKDDEIALTDVTEEQCGRIADAIWMDDQCLRYATLSEDQCGRAANPQWTWYAGVCRAAKEVECLRLGDSYEYRDGRCSERRPVPPPVDPIAFGFAKLCKEPTSLEVARTVALLVEAMDEVDCGEAAKKLSVAEKLDLQEAGIVDLTPLTGLTRLSTVLLRSNPELVDVSPLATIPSLRLLDLRGATGVRDISPLAKSEGLQFLLMDDTALDANPSLKTEANCPTAAGVNQAVRLFCSAR